MEKSEATNSIKDFLQYNREDLQSVFSEYKDIGMEIAKLIAVADKKYGSGEMTEDKILAIVGEKTEEPPVQVWKEYLPEFMKTNIIGNLPPELKALAIQNQALQGNSPNTNLKIGDREYNGNFKWGKSPQGFYFWSEIASGRWEIYYDDPSKYPLQTASEYAQSQQSPSQATSSQTASTGSLSAWTPDWKQLKMRPSPTRHASQSRIGEIGIGNDGNVWSVKADSSGVQKWYKEKGTNPIAPHNLSRLSIEDLKTMIDQKRDGQKLFSPTDDEYKELEREIKLTETELNKR